MPKTTKEISIEVALELVKSWNASEKTTPIKPSEFSEVLQETYAAISNLED